MPSDGASVFVLPVLLHDTKHIAETIEAKIIRLTIIEILIVMIVQKYRLLENQNSRNATLQNLFVEEGR
jgi:hypothetical protein